MKVTKRHKFALTHTIWDSLLIPFTAGFSYPYVTHKIKRSHIYGLIKSLRFLGINIYFSNDCVTIIVELYYEDK